MKWLAQNWSQVIDLAWAHLQLSLPAILLATLIAIPIGRLAFRYGRLGGALSSAATLLYAIPALPLLIIIPAVAGVPLRSDANMIIALTLYGIALLVRSAADGFASVDTTVRDASLAIGFSRSSVFWRVDLPLALPVILAGVRVVAVSTISLVTVGALIGVSSLGTLLTDGFQRGIFGEVLTGIIATIVLALVLDGLLLLLGRVLTPWRKAAA
ncbi:ABC transporter permease [Leucobacter aridicollis]|uniref:Osmoprotectant transport system permease protein n=1 Tax=Leucobacter aridicollis TaxID=283878 RepID=A0A852RHM0_9MICO|nr:ABC transporter permease subunit [Leucobacter aridicollis]MBL3683597.1 ABC transporter permease subunit [Leucobacter aridicollis]NYD28350.1 osmoprotectant transport system permease protein [Leucobacter aridicollis]